MSEFQNTNVPNVNWSQLNQRLRCATTEEKVEEILGTPSGALGTDSIVSLIPNRKKKHVKPTVHLEDKSDGGSSRQSFIFEYLPNPNMTPENIQLPPARQKALFKGRYFPSFGLICAPLAGTEIFPISPKMEKLHFAVAADMPLDHFDGEPQQQYLDDIKQYMDPIFQSYQVSNRDKFLHRYKNPNFNEEWAQKFPYSSHRFQEGNAIRGKIGEKEVFKVTLETNPDLLENYQENLSHGSLGERHGRGSKFRHEQLQVTASMQAQQFEARQIGFLAGQMKDESSESLINSDATGRKFDKFLTLAKTVLTKGQNFIPFHQQVPMLELHTLTTYEQFEDWIFKVRDQNEVPNATHEKCLLLPPWNDNFAMTQRLKIGSWFGTLIKYDRIKMIKHKVSIVLTRFKKV